jgi:signal transduction histidine kinase
VAQNTAHPAQERAQALGKVARNLQTITAIVNDLLFLQEVELIFAEFQPTDLLEVVKAAKEKLAEHARKNEVELILLTDGEIPKIPADPRTLERAVGAILDNAIKFSPNGGTVLIHLGEDEGRLFIRVQDHGVGIPKQALPRIFERFFHIDELAGHVFGGVGLGLPIAKQVVEQHGGEIRVSSKVGEGSIFTIYLNFPAS